MKKAILHLGFLILSTTFSWNASAQMTVIPQKEKLEIEQQVKTLILTPPNLQHVFAEDLQRDKNGELYRIGVSMTTFTTPENAGIWKTLPSGERVWQLKVKATGAEALSFLFDKFIIYGNTVVSVFDLNGKLVHEPLRVSDVQEHGMQNIALCFGDELILQIREPKNTKPSEIQLTEVMYGYRSTGNSIAAKINESDPCQVNVNCSEGSQWADERNGVARILVKDGFNQGWCSGALVNNAALDCKPYFLTALHCGVTSSTNDFNQWKFYFKYEATACTNPTSTGTLGGSSTTITGCVKKATSNDGGGNSGSDFLLVQLGSTSNEATTVTKLKSTAIQAYWNGWDANNTVVNNGVSIHHPAGDIKKISTYTSNLVTSGWNSNGLSSHWRVQWSATPSGHGVTEGGSSGSPIFNYNNGNSRIIGTLTGGSSYCNATSSPDYYGKMSYHWDQNSASGNIKLKTFLDAGNSGIKVLDGSFDPCDGTTPPPAPTGYCAATSTNCSYESIYNVLLGTINNTTGCTNYGDYTSLSTDLTRGQSYTITVTPQAAGTVGSAYTNDEIAVYIDWNNDLNFTGTGERVGYVKVATGWTNQFTFTVPTTATLGKLRMRVRISYQPDEGNISPCGTTADGEVEDYSVMIKPVSTAGIEENEMLQAVQIYPNPATDQLTIDFNELKTNLDLVQIKDVTGKLILELKNQGSKTIQVDLSSLSNGMYHVILQAEGIQATRKFVKN
ncbi:MAG: GEVED domain-containing protein [Crocinitomicaceae bacterium]|nr:GEVED domain-containing protein [Crocinitomicaceae bacterium]